MRYIIMKKKHVIALVCVLTLAVTLFSSFAFAEATEAGDNTRGEIKYSVRKTSTYIYNLPSRSSGYKYNFPIPVGTEMTKEGSSSDPDFVYVSCYYQGATRIGYVLLDHLTRVQ